VDHGPVVWAASVEPAEASVVPGDFRPEDLGAVGAVGAASHHREPEDEPEHGRIT
jgi:hypothetical protein